MKIKITKTCLICDPDTQNDPARRDELIFLKAGVILSGKGGWDGYTWNPERKPKD